MSNPDDFMEWTGEPCTCGDIYNDGEIRCPFCNGADRMRREWLRINAENKALREVIARHKDRLTTASVDLEDDLINANMSSVQ